MIFNLRNFNKVGTIFGIQHAAIRFWDLKFSPNSKGDPEKKISPHFFCCNGDDGYKKLKEIKLNENKIKKIEALRYKYIFENKVKSNIKNDFGKNVLIIGDNSVSSNYNFARTLNLLTKNGYDKKFNFSIKNHPVIKLNHLLNIKYSVTKKNLLELRNTHKLAIVPNNTSAAVDLYLLGYEVLSLFEKNNLNFSPLKGFSKITFMNQKKIIFFIRC